MITNRQEVMDEIICTVPERNKEKAKTLLESMSDEEFSSLEKNWNRIKKYTSSKEYWESVEKLKIQNRLDRANEMARKIINKKSNFV